MSSISSKYVSKNSLSNHTVSNQVVLPHAEVELNWHAILDQWLLDADIAPRSRISYKNAFKQFLSFLYKKKITAPNRSTILAYKQWLDDKGLEPFTRTHYLVVVRRFFCWTASQQLYPNICDGVKGVKRSTRQHCKDSLSIDHIKRLLGSINRTTLEGKRDFALLTLLIHTGLRLIEVQRALRSDIEISPQVPGQQLLWIRGKGRSGKDAFVVLTSRVTTALTDFWIDFDAAKKKSSKSLISLIPSLSDKNFGKAMTIHSLSRIIKGLLRAAGLNSHRLTAHSLRHTFGVLAIKSGSSLYDVQLAMRHHSPLTTEIYLGDIEQEKRKEHGPEEKIAALLGSELS